MKPPTRKWLALAGFILVCEAVGGLAGVATSRSVVDWYPTLIKPSWNPPAWLFGPVWTILYAMMGVAAWLVWQNDKDMPGRSRALLLFWIQLALNCLWSFIFFGARSPGGALIEIVFFLAALIAATWMFFGQRRIAGILMLPYLAWVSFASVLNFAIWWLNS